MSRIEKVNQSVKKEIGYIIQTELQDPKLQFVSITRVEVSRDLKHAKVFYSFLGGVEDGEPIAERLDRVRGFIRRELCNRLEMRYVPELNFIFDKSLEYSARIDQAIEEIKNEPKESH